MLIFFFEFAGENEKEPLFAIETDRKTLNHKLMAYPGC